MNVVNLNLYIKLGVSRLLSTKKVYPFGRGTVLAGTGPKQETVRFLLFERATAKNG